jgi:L-alanine-DL-glutamate epimerase-like enolase superfamily enzyme
MARWHHNSIHITSVVATPVVVPLRSPWVPPGVEQVRYILRAGTDRGLVGLGESSPGATLEQLRESARAVAGRPLDELCHAHLPIAPTPAYEAVELLVLDILGQAHKMPVYQLLGGARRDRVLGRACLMGPIDAATSVLDRAAAEGFTAALWHQDAATDVLALAQAIRRADARIALSVHGHERWSVLGSAPLMQELSEAGVESVIDPWPVPRAMETPGRSLRVLAQVHWPAEGEDWISPLQRPCAGYEIRAALAMSVRWSEVAAAWGRSCALAGELDLGVREAGRLHACLACADCRPSDLHGRLLRQHDLLHRPLETRDGAFLPPDAPGLGVQLDPRALQEYRRGPDMELVRV